MMFNCVVMPFFFFTKDTSSVWKINSTDLLPWDSQFPTLEELEFAARLTLGQNDWVVRCCWPKIKTQCQGVIMLYVHFELSEPKFSVHIPYDSVARTFIHLIKWGLACTRVRNKLSNLLWKSWVRVDTGSSPFCLKKQKGISFCLFN